MCVVIIFISIALYLLLIYYKEHEGDRAKYRLDVLIVKLVLIKATAIREFPIKGFSPFSLRHKEQKEFLM